MKELVIISGKGGTGKTSIMAAFSSLAENKVLCDADVDAADLHLIMDPEVVQRADYLRRGNRTTVFRFDDDVHRADPRELSPDHFVVDTDWMIARKPSDHVRLHFETHDARCGQRQSNDPPRDHNAAPRGYELQSARCHYFRQPWL